MFGRRAATAMAAGLTVLAAGPIVPLQAGAVSRSIIGADRTPFPTVPDRTKPPWHVGVIPNDPDVLARLRPGQMPSFLPPGVPDTRGQGTLSDPDQDSQQASTARSTAAPRLAPSSEPIATAETGPADGLRPASLSFNPQ